MFTNVTISNFRTFEKATLDDLGQTTALIGRNASGKSNLLHALDMFARLAAGTDGGRALEAFWGSRLVLQKVLPSFVADVSLAEGRYHYELSMARPSTQPESTGRPAPRFGLAERLRSPDGLVFTRAGNTFWFPDGVTGVRTGPDTPALAALAALLPADSPVRRLTEPLRQFLARVRYYPLDEPGRDSIASRLVSGSAYNEWAIGYRATGVLGEPVPLQILHLRLIGEDRFTELKDRLGRRGLRLIDNVTVTEYTSDGPRRPQLDPDTGLLDPNNLCAVTFHLRGAEGETGLERRFDQLSQGTRRLVRLLTAMAFGDNSVMLIEHPEDGIHRGLLKKVMGLFTTGFCPSQIILSTHSDTVLNGLAPEAIRFVSLDDGKSTVRKMTPAEQKAAREYIDSDAEGTLAEFAHSIED